MKRCACRPGCDQWAFNRRRYAVACGRRILAEREQAKRYGLGPVHDYPEHVIEAKYQAAYAAIQARRRTA